MTNDEIEINKLLQECIAEQKAIGLTPKDNIEIYFSVDPKTKEKPARNTGAVAFIDNDNRPVIVVTKISYKKLPTKYLKVLLHHELIHLNSSENGKLIQHKRDWQKYTELSNKIYQTYDINPLESYSLECFENKDSIPRYNCVASCPRCGLVSYYLIDKIEDYNLNIRCHNCGKKLIIKKD